MLVAVFSGVFVTVRVLVSVGGSGVEVGNDTGGGKVGGNILVAVAAGVGAIISVGAGWA